MVEVFRTNITDWAMAKILLGEIHTIFAHYKANFDLEDCDNILRVESKTGVVDPLPLIKVLKDFGFKAEPLTDDLPLTADLFSKEALTK